MAATVTGTQPVAGQPVFVPAPAVTVPAASAVGHPSAVAAPGGIIYYYPQAAAGGPLSMGAVYLPAVATQQPQYEYTPSDFLVASLFTVIMCGLFSPLSLFLSMPALICSLKSKKNAQGGAIKLARKQGIIAAYLNIATIVIALLVACVASGLVLGLYGPTYARAYHCLYSNRQCSY